VSSITYRQLLPEPAEVQADSLIASLDLAAQAPADRPYTVVNFSSTVDGDVSVQGRSGAIGDEGDRAMFHALREHVDAVLAGTGTVRAERYGRILGNEERRARRLASGQTSEPLACLITRSGELPVEIPLFAEPEAQIVVFSRGELQLDGVSATVHPEPYDPGAGRPLGQVMAILREKYGVRGLLCEGGPSLFGSLLGEQLVDELFLTVAPKLAGGDGGPNITAGEPLAALAEMRIRWLLERGDSLYLRYALS
jgi:riboflavin biosynthesis pyrimidine reductase